MTLSGVGTDVAADVLSYAWDLDGDTVFETTGASATFDASSLDGPTSVAVGFRVTDDDGGVAYDTATINVVNVNPTADAGGDYLTFDDTAITLTGTGFDVPGDALNVCVGPGRRQRVRDQRGQCHVRSGGNGAVRRDGYGVAAGHRRRRWRGD